MSVQSERLKLYSEFEKDAFPPIDALYSFALRMTGSRKKAKKLLVETYKRAFWFFEHLDRSTDIRAWLFRVIRNAYKDKFSAQSGDNYEAAFKEAELIYNNLKSSTYDIIYFEEKVIKELSDDELSEILSTLPEELRIVIILCDILHFNYDEISDFVDVPPGTAVLRLRRARVMFFTELYKRKGIAGNND